MRQLMLSVIVLLLAPIDAVRAATDPLALLGAHQGRWLGSLALPDGRTIHSGIDVFTRADQSVWASYASPDRDAYDIPVARIRAAGDRVELELPFATVRLAWLEHHFNGEWIQNGTSTPLELHEVDDFPRKHRPQDPIRPFPYREQTLAIAAGNDVTLGATLTVPNRRGRPSAVILVPGSGPQTRDEDGGGHRTFAVLADQLARQGIAVLRYDKRGVSRSTGDYAQHTQKELADDLLAVARALRARKQFGRVGLIGHSEGSMIAAAVVARDRQAADFVVSLEGVGLPGDAMIALQDKAYAADQGARGADLDRLMDYVHRYYGIILAQPDPKARIAALHAYLDGLDPRDKALVEKFNMNVGTLSLEQAADPALRALLLVDSQQDWRVVRCPVLALNGALDHQVPPESLDAIVAALHEGGNTHTQSAVLPSINHMLQTAQSGAEDEYAQIEQTIAPAVVRRIVAFVNNPH